MKKVIKIGFPIACIVIIGGTFYMLRNLDKKVEGSLKNKYTNSSVNETKNEVEENLVQEDISYTVPVEHEETNEVSDNNIANEVENTSNDDESNNT